VVVVVEEPLCVLVTTVVVVLEVEVVFATVVVVVVDEVVVVEGLEVAGPDATAAGLTGFTGGRLGTGGRRKWARSVSSSAILASAV